MAVKEARPRYNIKVLTERYEKDERSFQIYDQYRKNYKSTIVTGKFYSRADALDLSLADQKIVDDIKITKDKLPKDKFPWPVLESHNYGWFPETAFLDRHDERFYFPLKITPETKHETNLRMDKSMQLPKFTGIPFKL